MAYDLKYLSLYAAATKMKRIDRAQLKGRKVGRGHINKDKIWSQLYIYMTSHPRSTVVLLDTGTPGTSREIYSENV